MSVSVSVSELDFHFEIECVEMMELEFGFEGSVALR